MRKQNENSISNAIIADRNEEWDQAEDQHERTERQVDVEMTTNKKAA